MNKLFLIICITVIALGNCYEPIQRVIDSFVKTTTGSNVSISDDCFGSLFDKKAAQLITLESDIQVLQVYISVLLLSELKFCNIEDLLRILQKEAEKTISNHTFFETLPLKIHKMMKIASKLLESQNKTEESIGTAFGLAFNIFIGKEIPDTELDVYDKPPLDLFEFGVGFVKGLSQNESKTKCYNGIVEHKDALRNTFNKLYKAFITNDESLSQKILIEFETPEGLKENCRIIDLEIFENSFTIGYFIQEVVGRIPYLIMESGKLWRELLERQTINAFQFGVYSGKINKMIYGFYVD